MAFGLSQAETFYHTLSDGIFPWPKQLQETQVQLQLMLFNVVGDFYWQIYTEWPSWRSTAPRPFQLASVCRVRDLGGYNIWVWEH